MNVPNEVQQLAQSIATSADRIDSALGRLADYRASVASSAVIRVDAGSFGLWFSATCCAIMVVVAILMGLFGGFYLQDQDKRLDKMQDYLNAIYVQAPQLQPKENHSQ